MTAQKRGELDMPQCQKEKQQAEVASVAARHSADLATSPASKDVIGNAEPQLAPAPMGAPIRVFFLTESRAAVTHHGGLLGRFVR
jgi:hypothetical protein